MLSVEETLRRVKQVHKDKPFYKHPMWAGLLEGKFSKRQVQEFALQFGIIPLWNQNYHGRLYVHCPDYHWRARIAEVVYEEGTGRIYAGGVPHHRLYLDFGEDIGLTPEQMLGAKYCPEALGFRTYFQDACEGDFIRGVACHMLGAEAQGPGVFARMAETFKRKYDMTDKGVAFWVIHDSADEDHSSVGDELLADFAKTEQQRQLVIDTVKETVDMTMLLYDGIYKSMLAAG